MVIVYYVPIYILTLCAESASHHSVRRLRCCVDLDMANTMLVILRLRHAVQHAVAIKNVDHSVAIICTKKEAYIR